uniref:Uncharacterized protein n=1 Tax=Plectus sambesii TaxID=2011161 RepID=A0A914WR51_9BILA
MKGNIYLLLCSLAAFSFALPMRDGSKDAPETTNSSDAVALPTAISFKELADPTKVVIEGGKTDQPLLYRGRRDSEVPTPSEELANTTPLVIKGDMDSDSEPPTPSEELANTTPLVIMDGDPDQMERRLKRNAQQLPPTVALQQDSEETKIEEVEETTAEPVDPDTPQHHPAPQRPSRAANDVIPELGIPVMKSFEQKESETVSTSSSEEEQVENLGMPVSKEHVTDELPKTEDESGWSRARRYANDKSSSEEETATAKREEVEMPEAPSTAPLITDRLQVESEAPVLTKEEPEPTEAAEGASKDEQETSEITTTVPRVMDRAADEVQELTTETSKSDERVRRRRANQEPQGERQVSSESSSSSSEEKESSPTETPQPDVRRRRANQEPQGKRQVSSESSSSSEEQESSPTETPQPDVRRRRANQKLQGERQVSSESSSSSDEKEPSPIEKRRKRSEDDEEVDRMDEIEKVLAGKKVSSEEKESAARRKRSNESDDGGQESIHHKKPGVAGVEEAGLAATFDEQTAHIVTEEGSEMTATSEKTPVEEETKNERRRRRYAENEDAADATDADKKEEEAGTAGSELDTRTRGVGDRNDGDDSEEESVVTEEDNSNEGNVTEVRMKRRRSTDEEAEESYGEAGPAGGMSSGSIKPDGEQQTEDETGPAGGMSAGIIKPDDEQQTDEEVQSKRFRKRSATPDQQGNHDDTFHGTPDTTGTDFHEADCKGRLFC